MSKHYKTASGKMINLEALRLLNEKTPAVGNMQVNARGDKINSNGQIVKTRNELMREKKDETK